MSLVIVGVLTEKLAALGDFDCFWIGGWVCSVYREHSCLGIDQLGSSNVDHGINTNREMQTASHKFGRHVGKKCS